MSGLGSGVLTVRCEELEKHAGSAAGGIAGMSAADWEKFKTDYDIGAIPVADLFNRKDLNAAYVKELTSPRAGSAVRAALVKTQAEMLQALQRGTVMRYGRSRIWATAAAYGRRKGMADGKQIGRLPAFAAAVPI